jgi:hypothetical protein
MSQGPKRRRKLGRVGDVSAPETPSETEMSEAPTYDEMSIPDNVIKLRTTAKPAPIHEVFRDTDT